MAEFSRVERRFAGSEGEREMLHAVRRRLPEGLVGRIEPFVSHTSPALVAAVHDLILVVAGLLGLWRPWAGLPFALLVTGALVAEGTGRTSAVRWLMPMSPSYNFVVRPRVGPSQGSIVFTTPLDSAPIEPMDLPWLRRIRPMRATLAAATLITAMLSLRTLAEPWGPRTFELYVIALVVLAGAMALGIVAHRRPGPGTDDGSGAAALLELMRRLDQEPIPGVDVWFAFTGCGRSYQGGIQAFLTLHTRALRDPALICSVVEPGRVALRAVVSEGPLYPQAHRPTGPALIERLRWAGVGVPSVDHPDPSDARAARVMGFRAISFRGGDGTSSAEATARATDVLETVARWYADDLARIAVSRPALEQLAKATVDPENTDEEARAALARDGTTPPPPPERL